MVSLTIKLIETRLKSTFCISRDIWRGEKWPIAANNCEKCLSLLHSNLSRETYSDPNNKESLENSAGQNLRNQPPTQK